MSDDNIVDFDIFHEGDYEEEEFPPKIKITGLRISKTTSADHQEMSIIIDELVIGDGVDFTFDPFMSLFK
jgi:hypothetical protein